MKKIDHLLFRLTKKLPIVIAVAFGLIATEQDSFAAKVVYINQSTAPSATLRQLESVSNFYGLDLDVVTPAGGQKAVIAAIRDSSTVAIVVAADALPDISRAMLWKENIHQAPWLIAGITDQTSPALLSAWSSGSITDCRTSPVDPDNNWYSIANAKDITRQLGGTRLPLKQHHVFYLTIHSGASWLVAGMYGSAVLPVFAHSVVDGQRVFFATESELLDLPVTADPYRQQAFFASLASPMIFLHYASGERAWHTPGNYANLTIDDLWLREPYGHVNYEELLRQSREHNFHTTVAFIPWNFDRSQLGVVALFQANPDRLSICVHGNNHIHQEFGPLDSHPLPKQAEDIKQGIARMERFSQLTHIPYDAVMVFPHSISPEATLAELKRYNFLATANSLSVPSDAQPTSDPEFALRTATLQFANFPSMRRYSAETDIPEPQLAIDAFLGNPMLFYAHESFFSSGIGAFNSVADTVNRLQPDTTWRGLGYIARHLYLEKQRDDGNYDIQSYSSTIDLTNFHADNAVFFVRKDEDFVLPVTLLVDGQPYPFQRLKTQLQFELPIRSGASHEISIKYGNDFNLAATDIWKTSFKVNAIRALSDFRDDAVSRTALGRRFIHSYANDANVWNRSIGACAGLILLLLVFLRWRRARSGSVPQHGSSVAERRH